MIIKVLYILPSTTMYGDNIALLNIIPVLQKSGISPLFLVEANSMVYDVLKLRGYETITVPSIYYPSIYPILTVSYVLKFIKWKVKNILWGHAQIHRLIQIIDGYSPDLIHSNNSFTYLGYLLAKKMEIPHIWHIREYGKLDANRYYFPSKRVFVKKIVSVSNYCITITGDIKKYFRLSNNTAMIYDGVITSEDPIPDIKNKKEYFLFVGRLIPTKGVDIIIDSFVDFCKFNKDISLLIVGDSDDSKYKRKLKEKVLRESMGDRILFLGYRNDVNDLMSEAKALIVASQFEAFGFITAEAMYNGCPVIGHYTGGTAEQLDNIQSKLGKLIGYRYRNSAELTECLLKAIVGYSKSELKAVQEVVITLYSIQNSATLVFNKYRSILKF